MANVNESFIDGKEVVNQIVDSFYEHLNAVKQNVTAVNQLGAAYGKLPSDYLKTIKQITDAQLKQAKAERELTNASIASQRLRQAEITTMIKENALLREQLRTQQAQEKQARATGGSYQELSRELNATRADAKNLAADMYLLEQAGQKDSATFEQLQSEFAGTQAEVLRLDGALKNIDASLGQHQRNVGNYASGWNGLGNSINQLTRELPAFAVNMNTGFLAISNNLPALADEINRLRAENVALAESGEEPVSILEQLKDATFSWNTVISLGITLLTVYGGKIVEWASELFSANSALQSVTESQEALAKAQLEGIKSTVADQRALKSNLAISRDKNLSLEERTIALKKLRDEYPFYFKNLTDEQILAGDTAKAELAISAALDKRAEADTANTQIIKNRQRMLELADEERKKTEKLSEATREYNRLATATVAPSAAENAAQREVEALGKVQNIQADITKLKREQDELNKSNLTYEETILRLQKESIGLDYKEEEGKEVQREALVDFEASAYALQKTRLENELAFNKEIVDNEKNGYADREAAAVRYGEILLELNQNERDEELRLLKRGTAEQIAELKRRADEGEITQKNAAEVIKTVEKQAAYDRELIYENYSKGVIDANAEIESSLEGVWEALNEQEQTMRRLDFLANNARQLGNIFENVDANTTIAQYDKIKKRVEEINESEQDNQIENLRLQRQSIDAEIQKISEQQKTAQSNEALNDLLIKQKEIDNEILGIETERKKNAAAVTEEMKRATDAYLKNIQSSVLGGMGFGSLSSVVSGEFDKALDNAQTFQEKFAVIFNTVGNIAKDAFAFMTQNSQAAFDAEYVLLERRRDTAIKFAGENRAAQDEINRQYDERQREIKQRELKAQKEQAIFNAVINTAQGVTSALATANIPLSILIGALGAAQIAFIASQQIPAYAEGGVTDTAGNILVNDAKGANYKEVVVTPSGKTIKPNGRNRIMNVPKGTRIFKNYAEHEAALNGMLANAGIAPASGMLNRIRGIEASAGLTKSDLMNVMKQTIGSMSSNTTNVTLDRHGFDVHVENGHSQMQLRNNHLELRGRTFGRG